MITRLLKNVLSNAAVLCVMFIHRLSGKKQNWVAFSKHLDWWQSRSFTLQPSWDGSCLIVHVSHIKYNGNILPFFMGRKPQCTSSSDFSEHTQWTSEKVRSPRTPMSISFSWSPLILNKSAVFCPGFPNVLLKSHQPWGSYAIATYLVGST